jgi:hypothetical protein
MAGSSGISRFFLAFVAGFIAVLVFHQGMLTLLHAAGITPASPFPLKPTKPFGVPAIWSFSFWGGVWGLVFFLFERLFPRGAGYWLWAIIFGAVGPTLVAWFIAFPLKGLPVAAGWKPLGMLTGLLVNGAWGLGTALFLRGFSR